MNRAAVAYVVRDGLVLSVTRKDTGEHAAPGGRLRIGGAPWEPPGPKRYDKNWLVPDHRVEGLHEPWSEAACRELYEETGMNATTSRLVYRGWNGDWFVAVYLVEAEGEPVAREPGTRVEWVTPEQIANGFGGEFHRKALQAAGLLTT